jgi:hypothetical protein
VKLIEDHDSDAFQRLIALQPTRQNSFGHDFDSSRPADLRFEARAESYCLADRFSEHLRHALSDCSRRQPSRFEHHVFVIALLACFQQSKRDARGFACTGRRFEHNIAMCGERSPQIGERSFDGELG